MTNEQQYFLVGKIAGGILGTKLTDNQIIERAWRIAQGFITQLADDQLCWVAADLASGLLHSDPALNDTQCIDRCVRMTRGIVAISGGWAQGTTYGQEQARHGGSAG